MTESAANSNGNVLYPKFGTGIHPQDDTFEWPDNVDWSECAPKTVSETSEASDVVAEDRTEIGANVIEFPVRGVRS